MAKDGNEGIFCTNSRPGLGSSNWVADGSMRPNGPAILSIFRTLNVLEEEELIKLAGYRNPKVHNSEGVIGNTLYY